MLGIDGVINRVLLVLVLHFRSGGQEAHGNGIKLRRREKGMRRERDDDEEGGEEKKTGRWRRV